MPRRRRALAALAVAAAAGLASPLSVAASDKMLVTCGSSLKLEHAPTNYRLHPQEVAWSQSSGRPLVTAYHGDGSAHSAGGYWTLHCGDPPPPAKGGKSGAASAANPPPPSSARGGGAKAQKNHQAWTAPGAPVPHGARVRLQSSSTKKWLAASPDHRSPMTSNGEVSGYDEEKSGPADAKDVVWVVEWDDAQGAALPPPAEDEDEEGGGGGGDGKEKKKRREAAAAAVTKAAGKQGFWGGSSVVRLKHAGSGHWLSSHNRGRFGHPLTGHQEVSAAPGRPGGGEQWQTAEGVYLPVADHALLVGGDGGEGGGGAGGKDEL